MHAYQGTLTEDDYVEIARLQRQLLPGARTVAEWLLWFGVGFLFMSGWAYLGNRQNPSEALLWLGLAVPCLAVWWFRRPDPRKLWRSTPALHEPYAGQVTESALEARLVSVDARIPWPAFTARAGSARAIVLLAGHIFIPLARSFFQSEQEWADARAIVEKCVPLPSGKAGGHSVLRTTVFWLVLLLVIFLAWHFAQLPKVH